VATKKQRVKILDTKYTKKSNLVEWLVELENKDQLVLALPGDDIGPSIGIKGHMTTEQIKELCEKIKGKEVNLIIEGDQKEIPKLKDMTNDQIQKLSDEMDKFPFHEVISEINKSEKDEK
jgi:hypothetical protein